MQQTECETKAVIRGYTDAGRVKVNQRTPGPWYFDVEYDDHLGVGFAGVCNERGTIVAEVDGRDHDQTVANGNLIAAAPDLYLNLVAVMWELKARSQSGELKWCGAWNSAIRAIERAGGTNPWSK